MTRLLLAFLCVTGTMVGGCRSTTPEKARDLPAGDAEQGRQAFVDLQCTACHEVAGTNLPPPSVVPAIALGGRTLLPPSREELAEDILLPSSHFAVGYPVDQIKEGDRSRMPDYSKALSKEQVANLVAFLKSRYRLGLPSPTR